MLRTPVGYVNINSLLPASEVLGFALPEMPPEFDPGWSNWRAGSLTGLSYLATTILSNQPFISDKAVRINGALMTTPSHRYFVWDGEGYGWYEAQRLNTRHALVTMTGLVAVESVEQLEGTFTFFKMDVDAPDTLIAKTPFGDVLSHNAKEEQ